MILFNNIFTISFILFIIITDRNYKLTWCLSQQPQPAQSMEEEDIKYTQKKVKQLNKYEDILDVFIHIILLRLPTVYVLINMILMIWLVQTIYSSLNNDSVPRSLYLLAPFIPMKPVTGIYFTFENKCNPDFQQVTLKTLPSISSQSLKRSNLTKWKQSAVICMKKSQKYGNFSAVCADKQKLCSGLCVNLTSECPITSVRKINTNQNIMINDFVIFYTPDGLYKYVASRDNRATFVVGLIGQYEQRCANQFHYYDIYSTFQEFWSASTQCGNQEYVAPQIYQPFDTMKVTEFFENNGIWSDKISEILQDDIVELGYVKNVKLNNKKLECASASQVANDLSIRLQQGPISSLYSKNILIIAFVLFTLCWVWLVVAYCFEGWLFIKNIFMVLLAAIEFITLTFIYYQNLKIVQIQKMIALVSNCIDDPIQAFKNWQFGVEDRSPFLFILFASSSFLLLEIISVFINYCVYVPYQARVSIRDSQVSYESLGMNER